MINDDCLPSRIIENDYGNFYFDFHINHDNGSRHICVIQFIIRFLQYEYTKYVKII